MQACGRLVARKGEQDVDRDIAAGVEIDGGDMAPVMGNLDDPAIDDRYVAARQIGPDIGRNVVTIGEERQRVGPIVVQPDIIVRLPAGPDEAPMLAGDFKAVAIGAGYDGRAPAFGKARNIRHLVGDAIAQDQAPRPKAFAIASEDGEIVDGAGETGKAAADDDDVIHGDGLRVVDGGGWAGPGAQYRPAIRARDGQRAGLRHQNVSVRTWWLAWELSRSACGAHD